MSEIHTCKYRDQLEGILAKNRPIVQHGRSGSFIGWEELEKLLPKEIYAWLASLVETGPLWEVGVGGMHKIRSFGAACWRAGYRCGRFEKFNLNKPTGRKE